MASRIPTHRSTAADTGPDGTKPRSRKSTTVIADLGTTAEVLVFPPGETVREGVEFRHRGMLWTITGHRRDSGTLVAEPSNH